MRGFFCALVAAVTLAGCAQYAQVKPKRASLVGPPGPEPLGSAEKALAHALRLRGFQPRAALGECIETLDIASRELRRDPAHAIARRDYNFALSRAFEIIKRAKLDAWSKPLVVRGAH